MTTNAERRAITALHAAADALLSVTALTLDTQDIDLCERLAIEAVRSMADAGRADQALHLNTPSPT